MIVMSNHFTTIVTNEGVTIDLYVYRDTKGRTLLSTMVNNRSTKGFPKMDLDDLRHYSTAISLVAMEQITPENGKVYENKPPK